MERKFIGTTISVLHNSNSNAILELVSTHNWRNSRSFPQSSAFITNWSQCIKKKHPNQLKKTKKKKFLWWTLILQTISQPLRKRRLIEWPTRIHLALLLPTSSKIFMVMPKFTMIFLKLTKLSLRMLKNKKRAKCLKRSRGFKKLNLKRKRKKRANKLKNGKRKQEEREKEWF